MDDATARLVTIRSRLRTRANSPALVSDRAVETFSMRTTEAAKKKPLKRRGFKFLVPGG
jgi:hypothetical protein